MSSHQQPSQKVYLIRHGETEWSRSGQHTGRTNIPLTDAGRDAAVALGKYLDRHPFKLVLTSPLDRAHETCRLAGYGDQALVDDNLLEWNYGVYEGRTTLDIRKEDPSWSVWLSPIVNGESLEEVAARADRIVERAAAEAPGDVAIFAHGHVLRILATRWMGVAPLAGRYLALDTATVSVLGYERQTRVIRHWNVIPNGK